jgi:hypothetical protein
LRDSFPSDETTRSVLAVARAHRQVSVAVKKALITRITGQNGS